MRSNLSSDQNARHVTLNVSLFSDYIRNAATKSLKSHSLAFHTISDFLAETGPLLCVSSRSIPPLHAPLFDRIVIELRPGTKVRNTSQTAEYITDVIRSGYSFRKSAVPPI